MSLPRYEEYMVHEHQWFEELPIHWHFGSLKWLSKRYSGGTPDKNNIDFWTDGTIPWINSGAVNQINVTEPSDFITPEGFEKSSAKWIPSGALIMALAGQGKTKGMVAQTCLDVTCNQSMAAIIPTSKIDCRYLFWWLQSNYQNIRNMAGGDLRDGLNLEILGNISCPIPLSSEQKIIATFLDRETAKIDALISEQEKLITLLAEKRQATVSHVVTKGLNPNAPMKDSGVEWLGQVPEHWKVVPLMHLTNPLRPIMYGIVLPGISVESGIPIVKGGDVKPARLKVELLNRTTKEIELPYARARLRPQDIVYSIRGTIGDAEVVPDELLDANITQDVARISPANDIQTGWLIHVMKSEPIFVQLAQRSLGAAVPGINIRELKRAMVPVPPTEERAGMAVFLDAEIARLNALANEAARGIILLKERRSALISAAVTGKIDVRQTVQLDQITIQDAA